MIISPPFLTGTPGTDDAAFVRSCMINPNNEGLFPLGLGLTWHNGLHLHAPNGSGDLVRAISDGEVIYSHESKEVNTDANDPLNYNPWGLNTPAWTDNGLVILRHKTEIGAAGDTPTTVTFFSAYMHLQKHKDHPLPANGKTVYRKDVIGKAGQIYGAEHQIHFEICCDEPHLQTLLGVHAHSGWTSTAWRDPSTPPTANGRTDAVFGDIWFYLPAGTPTQTGAEQPGLVDSGNGALDTPQWVRLRYHEGTATFSSVDPHGQPIGHPFAEPGQTEYKLYDTAITLEAQKQALIDALDSPDGLTAHLTPAAREAAQHTHQRYAAPSSASGWYELLRFGRNLGPDALPADAAHWRKVPTPAGHHWVNLNASGTFKFSDADFLPIAGWNCFGDDTNPDDQRCDSPKLKQMIEDTMHMCLDADGFDQARKDDRVKKQCERVIAKFPIEWDKATIDTRWGWVQSDAHFKENPQNWNLLKAHMLAMSYDDLPDEYKAAQWHVHPVEFIASMRRCGWLSHDEMYQLFPMTAMRPVGHGQWVSESVSTRSFTPTLLQAKRHLNMTCRKYGIVTPTRMAAFYANAMQETGWFFRLHENNSHARYWPWDGRGFLQLTWPDNYIKYWRFIGRTVDKSIAERLHSAAKKANQERSNRPLMDENTGTSSEIRDWRNHLGDGRRIDLSADSAGAYWAWSGAASYADQRPNNQRETQTASGRSHAYYSSAGMGNVAATVNFGHPSTHYARVNGIVARFQAYVACQMILLDIPTFPNAHGQSESLPADYTQRRP